MKAVRVLLVGLAAAGMVGAGEVIVVVRGVEGEAALGESFDAEVAGWQAAGGSAAAAVRVVAPDGGETQRERTLGLIREVVAEMPTRLWLVLVGHGTHDGRESRFTVEGPDLKPTDLEESLADYAGALVFVHSGSASQPFGRALTGVNRVCVTATKSASEVFLTRFGLPFVTALGGEAVADWDQDGQVSVLEAFLHAAAAVRVFYETEERLATEHALLDDNGDGIGTRSERFEGVGLPEGGAAGDGGLAQRTVLVRSAEEQQLSAEMRSVRDGLEAELEQLKGQRGVLGEDAFFEKAEGLLRQLGEIYREAEHGAADVR